MGANGDADPGPGDAALRVVVRDALTMPDCTACDARTDLPMSGLRALCCACCTCTADCNQGMFCEAMGGSGKGCGEVFGGWEWEL